MAGVAHAKPLFVKMGEEFEGSEKPGLAGRKCFPGSGEEAENGTRPL